MTLEGPWRHESPTVASSQSFICLRASSSEDNIVCIPGAGGNVAAFVDLLSVLGLKWAIYGIQPRGLDLTREPDKSVEQAAWRNLGDLVRVIPAGRIHLIGHSYGGLVAYEMAVLLQAKARAPASLLMIDTEAPADGSLPPLDEQSILERFVTTISEQFEISISVNDQIIRNGDTDALVSEIHSALRQHGIVPERSNPAMLKGPLATFMAALNNRYSVRHGYDGNSLLAIASESFCTQNLRDQRDASVARWRSHVPHLCVRQMPGNHFSMLRSPNISALTGWWTEAICAG